MESKNKHSIITAVKGTTASGSSKRLEKPKYYENIDTAVLDWFKSARKQNLPIFGELIKEKALEFGKKLIAGEPVVLFNNFFCTKLQICRLML